MNKIDETSVITNDSKLGDGITIWKNVRVINSEIGDNCNIGDVTTVRDSKIGRNVIIQRYVDLLRVEIGDYSVIEKFDVFHDIKIGKFCEISWHCNGGGDNHNYHLPTIHHFYWNKQFGFESDSITLGGVNFNNKILAEECEIGHDCWIGAGVTINRKVHIGNGVVIGSGSVVTKDIPDYAIVVGIPAKIIRYRFDDKTIDSLKKISWWDWPYEILQENRHLFEVEVCDDTLSKMEEISNNLKINHYGRN